MSSAQHPPPSPVLELILTVVVPSVVLDSFSEPSRLGPVWALVVSMLFPIVFGIWCWRNKLGWNMFSTLGLVTVLLSGGLGLLKLDAFWFSVKESAMLLIIGAAFPLSHHLGRPLIQAMIFQPHMINLGAVEAALIDEDRWRRFRSTLLQGSWMLGLSMSGCAVPNFFLAMWLLGGKTPGSEAFVKGIGTLNWASAVVIGVLLMAVTLAVFIWLIRRMQHITGLEKADFMNPGRTLRRRVSNS